METIIGNILGWMIVIFIALIPVGWIWVWYHEIRCRKKETCENRKCSFWKLCEHTKAVRKKETMEELVRQIQQEQLSEKDVG